LNLTFHAKDVGNDKRFSVGQAVFGCPSPAGTAEWQTCPTSVLPSTLCIAKALQLIKGGSSKWVHESFPEHRLFGWQIKYGAFGVSVSLLDKTIRYIRAQAEHHRKRTFQEEFLALLRKHRIEYDERYLWD
jgi:hypothetical protein